VKTERAATGGKVGGEVMRKIGTVMLTLDGSEFADAAIEHVQALATVPGSRVVLLEVLPDRRGPAPFSIEGARISDRREASAHLSAAKQRLHEAGVRDVEIVTMQSASPAEAIAASAREFECDAVVMATHGRRGLRRLLKGSVAESVGQKLTDVPLVLIQPRAA